MPTAENLEETKKLYVIVFALHVRVIIHTCFNARIKLVEP